MGKQVMEVQSGAISSKWTVQAGAKSSTWTAQGKMQNSYIAK